MTPNDEFIALVRANPWNAALLDRMPDLGLGDWWLTAGCIAQSVWNAVAGRPADRGILDYDVFYFDTDTSWDAEDRVIQRVAAVCADLPIAIQVRNQARVPLWYEAKFGLPFPPVTRASDGIDRFPCATVAIGVRRDEHGFQLHAPFGTDLLLRGQLVPNPVLAIPSVYAEKTRRWQAEWPHLNVTPWPSR